MSLLFQYFYELCQDLLLLSVLVSTLLKMPMGFDIDPKEMRTRGVKGTGVNPKHFALFKIHPAQCGSTMCDRFFVFFKNIAFYFQVYLPLFINNEA